VSGSNPLHGLFVRVEVADSIRSDADAATRLQEACPVDIYANEGGTVAVVEENLDECVLCALCLRATPPGAVRVIKRYDGEAELEDPRSATGANGSS
jgi:NAD-dependent dihydropyrimidine dehydrogenase PreA subunit